MAGTPSACRVQHLRSFHSLFSSGCRSGRNWPQARGPAVARNARLWRDASGVAIVKGGGGSSCWKHASGVTTRQDVQNDTGGMDVVGQSLGAGGFDGVQAIGEHGPEDLDHLPVAAALSFELALHTAQGRWQIPVLERGPVAQCAGLARQDRDAIPRRNEFDSLRQFRLPPRRRDLPRFDRASRRRSKAPAFRQGSARVTPGRGRTGCARAAGWKAGRYP
jgi:hypothetical protein